jgi:hypothetical protein
MLHAWRTFLWWPNPVWLICVPLSAARILIPLLLVNRFSFARQMVVSD